MDFKKKFENISQKNRSLLSIGLDTEFAKLPQGFQKARFPLFEFNQWIIATTCDLVAAYKPNIAFYEVYGLDGLGQLKKTIEYLKKNYPGTPIILDAKRADIANTAKMYARAAFEYWGADATTVYPHLGKDSIDPFFKYKDKLTFVLLKTSNPDSGIFQNLQTKEGPYYMAQAQVIKNWDNQNIGVFVGATYPRELKELREVFPDKIFLSAGVGAQEANIQKAVKAGIDKNGSGIIFNASRSIIYAKDPRTAAENLRDEINKWRSV